MFEEAQLYSPVTTGDGGEVTVHLHDGHPGADDPDYRRRRNEIAAAALAWQPGAPAPADRLQRNRAGGVAHGLPRARAAARAPRGRRVPRGAGGRRPARRPDSRARRGQRAARVGWAAGATCPPPASSTCARSTARWPTGVFHSTQYVRHARDAALHARAGHRPRGHRPRPPARDADVRRAAPPRRRRRARGCAPSSRCASCRACSGSRSSSASSSRTATLRAYGAGILSSYGELGEFRAMQHAPAGPARDGHRRVRHHALPARPVPRRVRRRDRGGRRRLLRHLYRRIDRGAVP